MRARLLLTVSTLLLVVAAPAQDPGRRGRDWNNAPKVELKNFTFSESSFPSKAVHQDVSFAIYLPKDYDAPANKDVKWPLIVWLHGMFEDHMRFHIRGGAEVLDQVVSDGKLPPCVFVCADGGRTSMYFNRKDARWEDLITVDLLAYIAEHYRVSENREQRAIMGVSMGGMAALRIAFSNPELFGAVGAHSAAVFAEDPEQLPEGMKKMANRLGLDEVFGNPIQKEPWQKANPLCVAEAADAAKLKTLRIYFDAGTRDRYQFNAGNELLHAALDKRKIPHTWRLIEGGGHSWGAGFQDQTLPYSFAIVGEMFKAAAKDAGKPGDAAKPAEVAKPVDGKGPSDTPAPGGKH